MKTFLDELKDTKTGIVVNLTNGKQYYIFDDYDDTFEFAKIENTNYSTIEKTIEKIQLNDNFVSIWRTTINNETIKLPLVEYGEYNFTVEWGDGSFDKVTEYNQDSIMHTYLEPNDYTVKIYGKLKGFNFTDSFSLSSNNLIAILNWGVLELIDSQKSDTNNINDVNGIFKGCVNLELIKSLSELKSDNLTNANSMFENCNKLKDITGLIKFKKFHKVRNFENMFKNVTLSTNVYDIFLTHLNNSFLPIETTEDSKLNINFGNSRYSKSKQIRNDLNIRFNIIDGGENVNISILTFKTTTSNEPIKLPLEATGNYNFNVDWGDNTSDIITSYNQSEVTHYYENAGLHNIYISGVLEGFNFPHGCRDSKDKIIDVKQWGDLKLRTINYGSDGAYFYECSNLEDISATDAPDLSEVTEIDWMFYGCSKFNGNINHWDVSNVTDMTGLFYGCSVFNQPLNNWNVSNVTSLCDTFRDCHNFNQNINNWDVSNVTTLYGTFMNAYVFNQPLNDWNVGKVTDFFCTFADAHVFNQPLNNWNMISATRTWDMFWRCYKFNQPLNNWDTRNVVKMYGMFYYASKFNRNISNWNVSKVSDWKNFRYKCPLYNSYTPSKFR